MSILFFTVYPIVILVLSIVFIIFTVKLSGKDSPFPGAATVAMATVLFLCLNLVMVHRYGRAEVVRLNAPMEDGKTAEMYARIDDENRIVAYGPLEIKGEDGTVYDSEQIYNYEEELEYSDWGDMFKELTAGRTVKAKSAREKSLVADPKIMIAEGENGEMYEGNISLLYSMPLTCAGVPLLAVYLLQRRRVNRRRRAKELRRIEIQSL